MPSDLNFTRCSNISSAAACESAEAIAHFGKVAYGLRVSGNITQFFNLTIGLPISHSC